MHDEEYKEAGEGDGGWEEHKHEAMPQVVRRERGDHGERESARPWRDGQQLRSDGTVTEALDDARRKVR